MADRIIKVAYLDFADSYWVYEERTWGVYKGIEYFKAPITIGYADTLDEAVEIARGLKMAVNILNNYKWTSVDEALPIKEGAYLGVVDGEVREVNYSPKVKGLKWLCLWSTCNAEGFVPLADSQVTHWQPMPDLPEAIKG